MTKTLTEQWREGTLNFGWYYCLLDTSKCIAEPPQKIEVMYYENDFDYNEDLIIEVLSAVPSYDEIKRLQENLSEAETIFKIIKRNMENPNWHKDRQLTELEIAIKSQVVGYLSKWKV